MCGVVKVLAKSPNLKFKDQLVECPVSWHVIDLKRHLSELLNAELLHDSKLIHSGKLLNDDVVIGTAFNKNSKEENIVYFIMSNQQLSVTSQGEKQVENVRRRHIGSEEVPDGSSNNLQSTSYVPMVLNHHELNSQQRFEQSMGYDISPFWFNNAVSQMVWSQQVYAEYMNQYISYLEHMGQQSNAVPQEQVENIAQNNVQQEVPAMNVQGGLMDEDEDDRNRDWLDWAYVVMRFVMIMCVLYFYSTPVRFITFVIASIVFLIYQAGWLNVSFNELFRRQNVEHDNEIAEDENLQNRIIPQFVSTLWSIVVCFFVSLAPQAPPPINAN